MKKIFALFMVLLTILSCSATENDVPQLASGSDGTLFNGKKVLVAYFSWGGTTRRMAETIEEVTKGDIFEIEPVVPYPTAYTPCTEVALEEKNNNARPEIKNRVENWADYDIVFIGCPVWWWTTPMIIHTFAESYDFEGKTVVPFCTYAATYRDETLQAIVDMTPEAEHLEGLGTTGSTSGVEAWVNRISAVWEESHPDNNAGIEDVSVDLNSNDVTIYDLNGRIIKGVTNLKGIYIVKNSTGRFKIII
jgi:flavodoxin